MDEEWKNPFFYNRTDKSNEHVPINKLLKIEDFNIYWNSKIKF